MTDLAVTITTRVDDWRRNGRVLATVIRASKRDARAFADRNADTWRHVLFATEPRFLAVATDRDGAIVFVREYLRTDGAAPIEYSRAALRAFSEARR